MIDSHLTDYVDYPVHLARLYWILDRIEKTRPCDKCIRILDIGCGTGNITIPLGTIENASVLGIDFYSPNVDLLNQRNPFDHVEGKVMNAYDVDLESFDYIIFSEVIEHIPEWRELMQDVLNRSNNNVVLLVTIPNGYGVFEWAMTPMYWMRKLGLNGWIRNVKRWVGKKEPYALNQEEDPHVNFFTSGSWKKHMRNMHVEIVQWEKAFIWSPVIETYLPFVSLRKLSVIDWKWGQMSPRWLVSGWYFELQKTSKV